MDVLLTIYMFLLSCPVLLGFWSCCCGVACSKCDPTAITTQLQVTISGVAAGGSGICTSGCTSMNAVFLLDHDAGPNGSCGLTAAACQWQVYSPSITLECSVTEVGKNCGGFVVATAKAPGDVGFAVYATLINVRYCVDISGSLCQTSGQHSFTFRVDHGGSAPDCNAFSSVNVPNIDVSPGCDMSAAVCTMDSV